MSGACARTLAELSPTVDWTPLLAAVREAATARDSYDRGSAQDALAAHERDRPPQR